MLGHSGILSGLLVAALAVAPAANASTTQLAVPQLVDASDYVVRGTVSAMWVDEDDRGRHWTRVQLDVDAVYKGPAETDALQIDVLGGFLGAEGTLALDVPRFDEGEEVFLFAELLESGLLVPTNLQQGKHTVRIDPDNGREMLVRYNPPAERAYDHRFIPHPEPADRLYLDDLAQQVQARVELGWDGASIPGKSLDRLREMHPGVEVSR